MTMQNNKRLKTTDNQDITELESITFKAD